MPTDRMTTVVSYSVHYSRAVGWQASVVGGDLYRANYTQLFGVADICVSRQVVYI